MVGIYAKLALVILTVLFSSSFKFIRKQCIPIYVCVYSSYVNVIKHTKIREYIAGLDSWLLYYIRDYIIVLIKI